MVNPWHVVNWSGLIVLGAVIWLIQAQRSPEKLFLANASQPVFALVHIAEAEGSIADHRRLAEAAMHKLIPNESAPLSVPESAPPKKTKRGQ